LITEHSRRYLLSNYRPQLRASPLQASFLLASPKRETPGLGVYSFIAIDVRRELDGEAT